MARRHRRRAASDAEAPAELGKVRVSNKDAELVNGVLNDLSNWLKGDAPAEWRPPRMAIHLPMSNYFAWSLRFALNRHAQGHDGWPKRLTDPAELLAVCRDRSVLLGACRMTKAEKERAEEAAFDFHEKFGRADCRINGARFLAIAVVGFAEHVETIEDLGKLIPPPWAKQPGLF